MELRPPRPGCRSGAAGPSRRGFGVPALADAPVVLPPELFHDAVRRHVDGVTRPFDSSVATRSFCLSLSVTSRRRNFSCVSTTCASRMSDANFSCRSSRSPAKAGVPRRNRSVVPCDGSARRLLRPLPGPRTANADATRRRKRAGRMFSCSRYFATVRRAMRRPVCCRSSAILWSDSGSVLSSSSISVRILSLATVPRRPRPRPCQAAREEELELEHAARRLHVLVAGHAADGRLVHVDLARDLLQRERLQERDALARRNPAARATMHVITLIMVRRRCSMVWMSHLRGVQLALDVLASLAFCIGRVGALLLLAEDALVGVGDPQPRHVADRSAETTYSSSTRSTRRSGTT